METEGSHNYFPPTIQNILRFIAYLASVKKLSPGTVQTYVTAISFFSKLLTDTDISQKFVVQKLLSAYKRTGKAGDTRYPLTIDMLTRMIDCIFQSNLQHYYKVMFKAMLLTAFHAFLRVSEFTAASLYKPGISISFHDVTIKRNEEGKFYVELIIRKWKHSLNEPPFIILIQSREHSLYCPVRALSDYYVLRGCCSGPIFIHPSGQFVTRDYFVRYLQHFAFLSGYGDRNIKSHSLRIGAATTASIMGVPDDHIKRLGRWKTVAFLTYVRVPNFIV